MREAGGQGQRSTWWCSVTLTIVAIVAVSCGSKKIEPPEGLGPKSFPSPESAGQAVYNAARAEDTTAVLAIFGPEAKEYLLTEDPNKDKAALDKFAMEYEKMHRWAPAEGDEVVLDVGVESYPFPFPLVRTADGQWMFSPERARKEILARQIRDNELTVIEVLNQMADAQTEYFATTHDGIKVKQYAQRLISSDSKHDGLYWKAGEGEIESPLGPLVARASAEDYEKGTKESPQPFHGYLYGILKEQGTHAEGGAREYVVNGYMTGGFAFLAYPAEYRKSGVMTFLIGKDGLAYQKDLGPDTEETAKRIKVFDPDETWALVQ